MCFLQASLIVTEELHLITFETEVYHQGLKIDLEVSLNTRKLQCKYIALEKVKQTFVAEMMTTFSGLTIHTNQVTDFRYSPQPALWKFGNYAGKMLDLS